MAQLYSFDEKSMGDTAEVRQHLATYHMFLSLWRWCALHLAVVILFLVLLFGTGAGVIGSVLSAAVVAAIGVFCLTRKS